MRGNRKIGRRFAAALAIAVAIVCIGTAANAMGTRVSGPGYDGLVLDLPSAQKGVEVWIPSAEQIAEMERALPAYVKKYIKTHKVVLSRPVSKYKRHYVGVREAGRKLIGISFFSDRLDFVTSGSWLLRVGSGGGGGDDDLGAVYDVDRKKFLLFEIPPKATGPK